MERIEEVMERGFIVTKCPCVQLSGFVDAIESMWTLFSNAI